MAEEIADGVVCLSLLSPQALLETATNCYVIRHEHGVIVVDPPSPVVEVITIVLEAVRTWGALAGVVVTHGHADHIAGVAALVRAHGSGWVAGHARTFRSLQRVPGMPPLEGSRWRPLAEGQMVGGFKVLETPGHTADHLALWREGDGLLLAGDVVSGHGTTVIVPPDGNVIAYMNTLRRLRGMPIQIIGPGHGPAVREAALLLDYYITHREAREKALLAALAPTPKPLRALVEAVYTDVKPSLWGLAEHSLLAHLLKLESEGRAVQEDAGWRLV